MAPVSNSSDARGAAVVLVVDDSATMRASVTMTLEMGGYAVHSAADGAAAMQLIHAGLRPDLVLTDIVMPGVGGLELIRQARQVLRFTPIVALTTQGSASVRDEGRQSGATAWLLKPTGGRGLLEMVAHFINKPPAAAG